jgi:hypothetical protein
MKRYANIKIIKNTNPNVANLGAEYYQTNTYPEIPLNENDIYVITDVGDRLDLLAYQFYKDVTLYWIIAAANYDVLELDSLYISEGTQLRIPIDINNIINSYNQVNNL